MKHTFIFTLSIFLFFYQIVKAQNGYDWQDIILNEKETGVVPYKSIMDNSDNIYFLSRFKESINIADTTLYSSLGFGIYLSKYDVNHNLLWTKVLIDSKLANPISRLVVDPIGLEIDDSNYVYPIISYTDSAYFEGDLQVVDQSKTVYANTAILKINHEGQVVDDYHFKGSCQSFVRNIQVKESIFFQMDIVKGANENTDSCSCILAGDTTIYELSSKSIIGEMNRNTKELIWTKELNANGEIIWAVDMVRNDSNLYFTGHVQSKLDLVYGTDTLVIPNVFSNYTYIAKLDLLGQLIWWEYAAMQDNFSTVSPRKLLVNTNNDILLTLGNTSQNVLNHIHFSNSSTLFGATNNDRSYAVVNYDQNGNVKWKDISKSDRYESNFGITTDAEHNIYLSGDFQHHIVFNGDSLLSENFSRDMIITSYTKNGIKRWSHIVSGPGSEKGGDLFTDSEDDLHVFGTVQGSLMRFGSLVEYPGGGAFYLAKLKKHPLSVTNDHHDELDVNMWPNPSYGDFVIELLDEKFKKVVIYDILGQKIKEYNFIEDEMRLNVSNFTKGFYTINILTMSGKQMTHEMIVE